MPTSRFDWRFFARILVWFAQVDDFVDAWMTSATVWVPMYQFAFAVLLCWTYPQGLQKTPSYNYAVYCTGVCLGVLTGVWRCPQYHNAEAAERLRIVRGSITSWSFAFFAGRRFFLGLAVVFAVKALTKEILRFIIPAALRLCGIPHSDHEACKEKSTPIGYNVLTPIRLLNYAAVSWAVVEPCFHLFEWLQI
ncbi:unnamed protein product [Effrenium voratum]|nr:unnamed protein product [Effrenium voratum]